jgi:hypothetical protein
MFNALHKVDLFANSIRFYIKGKSKATSAIGVLMTLAVIGTIAVFAWLIGQDIYFKINPFINSNVFSTPNYEKVAINPSSFPFALCIDDGNYCNTI